jgi:hypothetical protein
MPDYILREAALLQLRDELAKENLNNEASYYARQGIATAIGVTLSLPAADVAPVVRCKDCENWHRGEHNYGECNKISERDNEGGASFDCDTEANDYCSDGWPRKESCV